MGLERLTGTAFRKLFTSELLGHDDDPLADLHQNPEWAPAPGKCDWQDPSVTGGPQLAEVRSRASRSELALADVYFTTLVLRSNTHGCSSSHGR